MDNSLKFTLQRVGKVLLNNGALVKAAHLTYWANHPKAVCVFEKYRDSLDAFMEGEAHLSSDKTESNKSVVTQ